MCVSIHPFRDWMAGVCIMDTNWQILMKHNMYITPLELSVHLGSFSYVFHCTN